MSIKAYKGFNKDMTCRGFQFSPGGEYEEPNAVACKSGFHSCEHPLDVFGYYPPNESRYFEVEADGEIDRKPYGDTKIASTHLKIGAEIGLHGMIQAAIKFTFDRAKHTEKSSVKGERLAAINEIDSGAASATGDSGAASATGYSGAASVSGKESIACGLGRECVAKGAVGCWIVLAEREEWPSIHIKSVKTAIVDGETIKADTFYRLINGEFIEA